MAIGKILEGKSIKRAARAAKATRGTVERWLRQVRQFGFQSLLTDGRHGHAHRSMKTDEVKETRRQIATALAGPLKPQVRARLIAIDRVLSGTPIDEVAASTCVLPDTVKDWLRVVTRDSIMPTLARWEGRGKPRPRQLDADPAALRELAAKERNPRVRRRMLAVACVAEGMGVYDAEVKVGLNRSAITKRVKQFREEGIAAFQDRRPFGRPKRLSDAHAHELRQEILRHPELTYEQLHHLMEARFGVRYRSCEGLRLLLKRDLGIVRRERRFREAVETEASRDLEQHSTAPRLAEPGARPSAPRGPSNSTDH